VGQEVIDETCQNVFTGGVSAGGVPTKQYAQNANTSLRVVKRNRTGTSVPTGELFATGPPYFH